jgi:hypothetical protein
MMCPVGMGSNCFKAMLNTIDTYKTLTRSIAHGCKRALGDKGIVFRLWYIATYIIYYLRLGVSNISYTVDTSIL